mgnify:FL=1
MIGCLLLRVLAIALFVTLAVMTWSTHVTRRSIPDVPEVPSPIAGRDAAQAPVASEGLEEDKEHARLTPSFFGAAN